MKAVAVFPEQREVKLVDHTEASLQTRTDVTLRRPSRGITNVVRME